MAARAIGQAGMVEIRIPPVTTCGVTLRALARIVIGRRRVTTRTVGQAGVIESRIRPGATGGVALRALPGVVVGGSVGSMAGLAVSQAGVVEGCVCPVRGIVAL